MGYGKNPLFLYGNKFTLETDQKPLVSICQKHLVDVSPRIQRLMVRKLPSLTSSAVCKEISNIFTEFGKQYIIRSDNGPCYASKEFKELIELFHVQHVTSSPHFPQSNGFAEAMVNIAKKLMAHSTLQEKPWNFGFMDHRCTPLTKNIPSTLELLTG